MYRQHVLVFDSGLGGLSIVSKLRAALPDICISYLGDNALFPYGELDKLRLVRRIVDLLSEAADSKAIDLIIIACNTASTAALEALRAKINIPIVGVVPAIKPAAALSQKKIIGLIATPATINRSYTEGLITDFASDCEVLKIGSTQLVKCAESKPKDSQEQINAALAGWRTLPKAKQPDVVILGCTHFPLISYEIQQALGPGVTLIDSGDAIASRVHHLLELSNSVRSIPVSTKKDTAYFTNPNAITYSHKQILKNAGFLDIELWENML